MHIKQLFVPIINWVLLQRDFKSYYKRHYDSFIFILFFYRISICSQEIQWLSILVVDSTITPCSLLNLEIIPRENLICFLSKTLDLLFIANSNWIPYIFFSFLLKYVTLLVFIMRRSKYGYMYLYSFIKLETPILIKS
jgi:hypothetical protein